MSLIAFDNGAAHEIMMIKNSGFTLIELMIVIAIIGILASVATPLYVGHIRKSQYVEVAQGAKLAKASIETCLSFENSVDDCDSAAELQPHGYRPGFASNSILIDTVEIVRIGPSIAARVIPATGVVGSTYLEAADTYVLRADIALRAADLYIESWSVDPSSGCIVKEYC